MALKAKKPTATEKRLKLFMYGPPGVGKTTAALQFPRPYFIDTERGAENDQYVDLLNKSGGAYLFTTSPDELIAEVKALISEKHEYRTLVIDPLTVIYNDLLDKGIQIEGSDEYARHKKHADRPVKHLCSLLLRLDMNVVITSHAKDKWVRTKDAKGKDTVAQDGITFDCYGKLDYLFDLVVELSKRGKDRVGTVRKTRLSAFLDGEVFPWSYDAIADKYGRSVLERDAIAVTLATPEQVAQLRGLLADRKNGAEMESKWLEKADANDLSELTSEQAEKAIGFLMGQNKEQA
jgi:hypothetical protein